MTKEAHLSREQIEAMDKCYRVAFINSLPGYKSLNLIGTQDESGQTNLCIVSTVTHFGSAPPLLGFVSRPATVDRHTLSNIIDTDSYTINHVGAAYYRAAHQTSARYPREESEFQATGLTPVWRNGLTAPFVREAPVQIHLTPVEQIDIKSNGTVLIIGEVTDVYLADELIEADGNIDLGKAETVCGSGLDGYYAPEKLARLSYAKVGKELTDI